MFVLNRFTYGELFLILLCAFLAFLALVLLFLILKTSLRHKRKSFLELMDEKKTIRLSIVIDMQRQIVETYYVYETHNKSKTLHYDEFTYGFDSENLKKLNDWLKAIDESNVGYNRRIEVQIYDNSGKKKLYRYSLQNYIKDSKKYFITAQDITDSYQIIQDYNKKLAEYDIENFFENAQKILKNKLDNEYAYIISLRYKEFESITKDFKEDFIKLIDYEVLNRLEAILDEDMAICQNKEATFTILISKLSSPSKLKQRLKKLIQLCSGSIKVNNRTFDINFLAGVIGVSLNSDLSDATEKSEIALSQTLKRRFLNDKIKFFDEELSNIERQKMENISMVRDIINNETFELVSIPIIDTNSKKVVAYKLDLFLGNGVELNKEQFLSYAQEIGERRNFFTKLFDKIYNMNLNMPVYINISHEQIPRFCAAYAAKDYFKTIKLKVVISFDTLEVTEMNMVSLEKTIKINMDYYKIEFGVLVNNFKDQYLNELIYSKLKFMMIEGNVINKSFTSSHNKIALHTNEMVANQYNFEIIGSDISSLEQYEKLYEMESKYISGPLFNNKLSDNQITDSNFLKQISEIENRRQG